MLFQKQEVTHDGGHPEVFRGTSHTLFLELGPDAQAFWDHIVYTADIRS